MNLSKQQLLAWARRKQPDDIVGYAGMYDQCPLALYLNECCPVSYERWCVSFRRISRMAGAVETFVRPMDELERTLIQKVDRKDAGEAITVAEFMTMLEDCV